MMAGPWLALLTHAPGARRNDEVATGFKGTELRLNILPALFPRKTQL